MSEPVEKTYQVNHLSLACKVWGDGHPCIALHGWLDNAGSFDVLGPGLPGSKVIAVDLPGHGFSDHRPPGTQAHFFDYVTDVLNLANTLDLETFDLVGHSMGGGVAVLLAAALPKRVRRLVLLDSVGPITTEPDEVVSQFRQSLSFELPDRVGRLYESKDQAISARLFGGMPIGREAAGILCKRGLVKHDAGFCWRADPRLLAPSMVRLTHAQLKAMVAEIHSPMCLILAEEGIRHFRQDEFQRHLDSFAGAQIEYLPGGHHFHLEQSASAMADIIQAFLEN